MDILHATAACGGKFPSNTLLLHPRPVPDLFVFDAVMKKLEERMKKILEETDADNFVAGAKGFLHNVSKWVSDNPDKANFASALHLATCFVYFIHSAYSYHELLNNIPLREKELRTFAAALSRVRDDHMKPMKDFIQYLVGGAFMDSGYMYQRINEFKYHFLEAQRVIRSVSRDLKVLQEQVLREKQTADTGVYVGALLTASGGIVVSGGATLGLLSPGATNMVMGGTLLAFGGTVCCWFKSIACDSLLRKINAINSGLKDLDDEVESMNMLQESLVRPQSKGNGNGSQTTNLTSKPKLSEKLKSKKGDGSSSQTTNLTSKPKLSGKQLKNEKGSPALVLLVLLALLVPLIIKVW